jgi:hypothetical protein
MRKLMALYAVRIAQMLVTKGFEDAYCEYYTRKGRGMFSINLGGLCCYQMTKTEFGDYFEWLHKGNNGTPDDFRNERTI